MTLVPPEDTKRLLEQLTSQYEASLVESQGESYLLERGITREVQNCFRLGFVADPIPEQRGYAGTVSIPYISTSGSIVGIKYRRLDGVKPKYSSSLGFEARRIFNPFILARKYRKVYITEGEFDTIVLRQLDVPAVAIPGANAWGPATSRALRHRRLVCLADGDDSGEGYRLAKQITKDNEDASIILMKDTDVNQYYLDHGKDKLLEYIGWYG